MRAAFKFVSTALSFAAHRSVTFNSLTLAVP